MKRYRTTMNVARSFGICLCLYASGVVAQVPTKPPTTSTLPQRQTGVAERYGKLEELLLRLADVEADENPERAALLRRAAKQSRDKFTLEKLRGATEALSSDQFQNAVIRQGEASEGIEALLTLLLSEDRSKRIRDEKQRVAEMIKDLKRIERAQRSTRARTENGAEMGDVEQEQQSITDRARELNKELAGDEKPDLEAKDEASESAQPKDAEAESGEDQPEGSAEGEPRQSMPQEPTPSEAEAKQGEPQESDSDPQSEKPEDGKPGESKPEESEPGESEPGESEPGESKPGEAKPGESKPGESKPGESKPGEPKPGEPKPGESKPGDSKPGESSESQAAESPSSQQQQDKSSQQPQSPQQQAEQQLQDAIQKMQEAEQKLAEAKRDSAAEDQRAAEENLRAAIDRLERILRQLREEEMQRELAKLEARLRKMAAMQSKVLDATVTLAATPKSQRNRQTDLKAGELAFEEKKITLEADRAMLLLREEGSSVAFPEVVDAIRSDTAKVADRLAETKLDQVTQGLQKDILAALEEMIAALQKAQRDLEQKKQEQQQGEPQQQGQGEQPLVESLAELKLIRTMETRIKSTTERYAGMLEAGETTGDDVLPLLQGLSERQNRLYRITRDLVLKRNQ